MKVTPELWEHSDKLNEERHLEFPLIVIWNHIVDVGHVIDGVEESSRESSRVLILDTVEPAEINSHTFPAPHMCTRVPAYEVGHKEALSQANFNVMQLGLRRLPTKTKGGMDLGIIEEFLGM